MADVLSQSEMESLLAAVDHATSWGGEQNEPGDVSSSQAGSCDFKRPERVTKEQMRAFQAVHESFAREFGAALSAMVRSTAEVKLISVDQLTYSEFVFSLENPTCFNLLKADPLNGDIIIELNPSIVFPIIDCLLGGGRAPLRNVPPRPLTEIELRLASRITDRAIEALRNAWSGVCDLSLKVMQVESNPQLVRIVPPHEIVVLISLEVSMGDRRGIMNVCLPLPVIEPVAGKLSASAWSSPARKRADRRQMPNLESGAANTGVEMVVYLASTRLTAEELAGLAVGDVIVTANNHRLPLEVCVEGEPKYCGFAGLARGRKAVRIGKPIIPPVEAVEKKRATTND